MRLLFGARRTVRTIADGNGLVLTATEQIRSFVPILLFAKAPRLEAAAALCNPQRRQVEHEPAGLYCFRKLIDAALGSKRLFTVASSTTSCPVRRVARPNQSLSPCALPDHERFWRRAVHHRLSRAATNCSVAKARMGRCAKRPRVKVRRGKEDSGSR